MTHPGGRPLKFQSVSDLDAAIDSYFDSCRDSEGKWIKPATVTGLALALGTTRKTLLNYQDRPEFLPSLLRAKTFAENFAEEQLFFGRNPSGAQFALKNNYEGWDDSSSVNIGGQPDNPFKAEVAVSIGPEEAYRKMLDE